MPVGHRRRRLQRAAVQRQRAVQVSEIGFGRDRQRAAAHRRAALVGIGARQRQRAGTRHRQPARSSDRAGKGRAAGRAYHQPVGPQIDRRARDADQILDGLVAAAARDVEDRARRGEVHAARALDGATARQRQGSGVDGGGAGVARGAGQGQRARARGRKATTAADRSVPGQRRPQIGAKSSAAIDEYDRPAARQARRRLQCTAVQLQIAKRAAETGVRRDRQGAAGDAGASAVSIGAGQCLRPGTLLDETTVAADRTGKGRRRGPIDRQGATSQVDRRSRDARQPLDGRVAAAAGDIKSGTGDRKTDAARLRETAEAGKRQRAGGDGGCAGIGVASRQFERSRSRHRQPADAGDRLPESERRARSRHDRSTCSVQGDRPIGREVPRRLQRAAVEGEARACCAQIAVGRDRECAGIECRAAAIGVGGRQCQRAGARHRQAAGPADGAGHREHCAHIWTERSSAAAQRN